MEKAKSFNITKREVYEAYKVVKANKGSAGIDNISLEEFDKDLGNNLYKIWNRMVSGSYFPQPVKAVEIPKKSGGIRVLGIPTIADRIAQMVVRNSLEPHVEPYFLSDSYGYRPNKSAHDAIDITRQRCWKYNWVLEFDIKGLFDNINHQLLMKAVHRHTQHKWEVLYIERWLTAAMVDKEGNVIPRTKGTPQGGVISPLLANIFLHYAFDMWITNKFPTNPWCRYADDGIIHCHSKSQAEHIYSCLTARMKECELEIHPGKTAIVYCKDSNRKENHKNIQFTFLGYSFRPRKAKARNGSSFTSFIPAISKDAKKHIRETIKGWYLLHQSEKTLQSLAVKYNPAIRGWLNYYGKYGRIELAKVLQHINLHLMWWIRRKFLKYKYKTKRSYLNLQHISNSYPDLFEHWKVGIVPK
jgi:RNA-directed DNA polymerase